MNATKILNSEIAGLKISSLPSRPTAPSAFGGRGYTTLQMKEAFDKLPLFIVERFNTLLEDIGSTDENSLAAAIMTGISEGHSLKELFGDITDGELIEYLWLGSESLGDFYRRALELLTTHASEIENIYSILNEKNIDCGTPLMRSAEGEVK